MGKQYRRLVYVPLLRKTLTVESKTNLAQILTSLYMLGFALDLFMK